MLLLCIPRRLLCNKKAKNQTQAQNKRVFFLLLSIILATRCTLLLGKDHSVCEPRGNCNHGSTTALLSCTKAINRFLNPDKPLKASPSSQKWLGQPGEVNNMLTVHCSSQHQEQRTDFSLFLWRRSVRMTQAAQIAEGKSNREEGRRGSKTDKVIYHLCASGNTPHRSLIKLSKFPRCSQMESWHQGIVMHECSIFSLSAGY